MTHTTPDTEARLTLGQQLKQAREALNLSIEEVALKTHLKKNHIDSLEQDIFILKDVAPAFVRGYVRNYVRFLRLPESLISTVNYGEISIPKEVMNTQSIKITPKAQLRWLKSITILILLIAAGMTVAWWWQEHQKEEARVEAMLSQAQQAQPVAVQPAVQAETPVAPAALPTPEAQPTTVVSPTTANEQANIAPVNTTPAPETAVNVLQQPTAPVVDVAQATPSNENATENAVESGDLRIEITGSQSWITVRGDKRKRLAEKLYNNGERLSFSGNEQYQLTIGAPANVKVFYKGNEIPLKVDGRVARFKLPQ